LARKRSKGLTDREAEILAILWEAGDASVEEIRRELPQAPTANTVRKLLAIMVERRLVQGDRSVYGRRYRPAIKPDALQEAAVKRLLDTLFEGSAESLVQHLFAAQLLSPADLQRLGRRKNGELSEEP
jgi:predicted transcriptional regulator